MPTLTKADLADALFKNLEVSRPDALDLAESVLELVKATLVQGETVKLPGFGNFSVRDKQSRRGRNPKTGEEVEITARRVLVFHPSGILQNRVNTHLAKDTK